MQYMYGWAKRPMLPRLGQMLNSQVPITVIVGQRSWMRSVGDGTCLGEAVSGLRPDSHVEIHSVPEAGHHVHADQPEMFSEIVNDVCATVDEGRDVYHKRVVSGDGEPE